MRRAYLFGDINNERTEKLIAQMYELFEESNEPITIYVNSCGGSVTDALAIYDVLQNAPCEIYTVALGKVHSAAMTVLLAAPRTNRASYPNTEFMSHDISWKSDGPRAFLRDRVDQLERTVNQLLGVYTRDTDLTAEEARRLFFSDMADHYFTSGQARDLGIVSRIINNDGLSERTRANPESVRVETSTGIQSEVMSPVNTSEQHQE